MSREDEKLDAAEYVIGTLSGAERAAFEMLAEADPQARADVGFWENVFGSLNASLSPTIPSQQVWEKIAAEIGEAPVVSVPPTEPASGETETSVAAPVVPVPPMPPRMEQTSTAAPTNVTETTAEAAAASRTVAETAVETAPAKVAETVTQTVAAPASAVETAVKAVAAPAVVAKPVSAVVANDNLIKLQRSRSRWRWGAIAATIAAVAFGTLTYNTGLRDTLVAKYLPGSALDSGKSYIAVVNTPDQPAMIVKVNAKTGEVSVRSISVNRPEGKSYELWYVPEGQKAVSVGLVGEGGIDLGGIPAKQGDLLAISVEPSGGSPTGTATGPIIYTGKLIEDIDAQ